MTSAIKIFFIASLLIFLSSATLFAQTVNRVEARPKNVPGAVFPKIALESGLTGKVSVLVEVDKDGNVLSATDPIGPDWVCPAVVRPDVVALRESAVEAARKATFYPATENGAPVSTTFRLDFQFSSKEPGPPKATDKTTVTGESSGSPAAQESKPMRLGSGPILVASIGTAPTNGSNASGESSETISGGVLNGKAISLPNPSYPPAARAVRASGAVLIQVLILEDGSIFSAEAVSGHPLLQAASRIAACASHFSPTLLQGQPVKVSGIITYNFVP